MIVKEKNGEGIYLDLRICDNLELMAEIKDNTIDLIYCDILYGTGRNFGDYQDLKPIRSEIESHYLPRLKEMHRVLKTTGSIYLQMDTRINHWIRCIMDDIFGYEHFLNEIIYEQQKGGKGKKFQLSHDNILLYTKTKKYIFNINFCQEKEATNKRYDKVADDGKRYKTYFKKDGSFWYNSFYNGKIISDVWTDINNINSKSGESVNYDTQKPKALIERIIKASSNKGDLVADFYAGSFTTAEVCKDLKRNFIGCDINPNCFEKAKERGLFSFTDLTTKLD